jgi:hypothetical protein
MDKEKEKESLRKKRKKKENPNVLYTPENKSIEANRR